MQPGWVVLKAWLGWGLGWGEAGGPLLYRGAFQMAPQLPCRRGGLLLSAASARRPPKARTLEQECEGHRPGVPSTRGTTWYPPGVAGPLTIRPQRVPGSTMAQAPGHPSLGYTFHGDAGSEVPQLPERCLLSRWPRHFPTRPLQAYAHLCLKVPGREPLGVGRGPFHCADRATHS